MRNDKYDIPLQLERNSRSGFFKVITNDKITKLQMTNITNAKWQNNKITNDKCNKCQMTK